MGNIYISDTYNERIRKIDSTGKITTFAGVGQSGYQGDGGPAFQAYISVPQGLRFDPSGNLVFADSNNNAIRSINPQGVITTIAGTGTAGYNGDGISATQAQLNLPTDVAFDSAGNLYIADAKNNRIRRVGSNKTITTVAGTRIAGFSGDGLATGLGLKLEERQVPTPVIVVESVNEKPSENPPGLAEALPTIPLPTEFEVASVKPSDPGSERMSRYQTRPGGSLKAEGMPMRFLRRAMCTTDSASA